MSSALVSVAALVNIFPDYMSMDIALGWTAACVIALWLTVVSGMYAWRWSRVKVVDEIIDDRIIWRASSDPYVDPQHGILIKFTNPKNGEVAETLLNPSWIHLLAGHSTPTVNQEKNETYIPGKSFGKVKAGSEPASLVAIKCDGNIIGFGTRVVFEQVDYLLTAHHVWNRFPGPSSLAKGGKQVDVDGWVEMFSSSNPSLDFSLIKVPSVVWAKLGVKAASIAPLNVVEPVAVYGGSNSSEVLAGFGDARPLDTFRWKIVHTSPTTDGWSGTPLFSSRGVVGMHLGIDKVGQSNRAVNIGWVLTCLLRSTETAPPELSMLEIDYEDVELRTDEFEEVTIKGKGTALLGPREFAWKPKTGKYWADEEEEMDFSVPAFGNETVQPLNCQGAADKKVLPPSLNLRPMSSPLKTSLTERVCPSTGLENRIAGLEKSLERLQQTLLNKLQENSRSSMTSAGQSVVQTQSVNLCSTKPPVSKDPLSQETLRKLAKSSLSDIRAVNPSGALELQNGPSTTSSKKSSRRRNRKKSTGKQALGSPCPA